jgi:uncharacterized membrane protein
MIKMMNLSTKSVCLLSALAFALVSCKHKTNFSDLTEVSYATSISPIINSNCAFSGCHGDSATVSFNLTTYNGLMGGGIEAGAPEKSKLYSVLKTLKEEKIMPKKPYNELTEKQIQLIYVWIGQGANNN